MQDSRADGERAASTSRRGFLRLAAVAAGGTAAASGVRGAGTPDRWFSDARWSGLRDVLAVDDGYLATGIRTNADGEQVGWALRLGDDLGAVWSRTYRAPPHLEETDVGEDSSGLEFALPAADGFLLVGWWHSLSSDNRNGWAVRVDEAGDPAWSRTYRREDVNSFRDGFAGGLPTADGFLLVGRTIASEFLDERSGDGWVVSLSERGQIDWERAYSAGAEPSEGFTDDDHHAEFSAVTAAEDGFLVVGEASPDGPTESNPTAGWAVRIGDAGDEAWSETYRQRGDARNEFRAVTATGDGYVFAGVSGEETYVRPLHDYEMGGTGWVVGVDADGAEQWSDDGGDGFHAVAESDAGALLAGHRDEQGWAVEYDADGGRTDTEATEGAAGSAYSGVAATANGHLLVGHGEQDGETDALLAEVDGAASEAPEEPAEAEERVLSVVVTERGELRYEFTVDGTVEEARVNGRIRAEQNDVRTEHDDGTVTVSGYTGKPGYDDAEFGDAFRVTGPVTAFEQTGGSADFLLRLDGERVTPEDLVA